MNLLQLGTNSGDDHVLQFVKKHNLKLDNIVLVEPIKQCLPIIQENYKDYDFKYDSSVIIPNSIPNVGEIDFYHTNHTTFDYNDGNFEVSSIKEDLTSRRARNYKTLGTKSKLPTLYFDQLCNKYNLNTIDFLFMDIEGIDDQIFNELDLKKYDFKIIMWECPQRNEYKIPPGFKTKWLGGFGSRVIYKEQYENYIQDIRCRLQ